MLTEFHVGLDDTDSRTGGCTTYTAAVIFDELCQNGFTPSDFPWLVRLNPNIPWKTRGNGALAIHLRANSEDIGPIRDMVLETVIHTSEISPHTDPAVVFLEGPVPKVLRDYSTRALHDVLSVREATQVAKSAAAEIRPIRGKRGIIGSLAAIGADLQANDHTFEIIAYRTRDSLRKPRRVNLDSIRRMDSELGDRTFHNVDPETGRILVCPHGPDPVLLGIRGSGPNSVLEAFTRVEVQEPIERVMIFRTNQGTDSHIRHLRNVSDLRPFQSAVLSGRVETVPRTLRGGHVVFSLHDGTGCVDCLTFEPTGSLNRIARELLPGDMITVSGGVRRRRNRPVSLNLEKIEIQQLTNAFHTENPRCPRCGGRCESMGRDQGFRCRKCGLRDRNLVGSIQCLERNLSCSVYIPSTRARRHLTKPCATRHPVIV